MATSTVRYYEKIGLLPAPEREANGYRLYDEEALGRLTFISSAKKLGMSLDEIVELTGVWETSRCQPIQERLRAFLVGRIAEVDAQIVELVSFHGQLEVALGRLMSLKDLPEFCEPDCGCLSAGEDSSDAVVPAPSPGRRRASSARS